MPRKKKTEPIEGLPKDIDNKLVVQKSKPLMELWNSDLSLAEFKILDTYLARINSRKPDKRVVVLEKGEIEKALGVTKISADNLADRLIRLGQGIKIADPTKKSGFRIMWILEEVKAEVDDYGQWKVTLEANHKALQYFFNIEDLGYFRYKLRSVAGLTSRYSYVLFMYLEDNRFRKSWEIDVDKLRKVLNCDNDESYKAFKVFNDRILKRCHKELTEKTECKYSYEAVKKGRKVVSIKFTVQTLKDLESDDDIDENQMTFEELEETFIDDDTEFLRSACLLPSGEPEFNRTEIEYLVALFSSVSERHKTPLDQLPIGCYNWKFQCHDYLLRAYRKMNLADERLKKKNDGTGIKNRFDYLKKMIEKDIEE